MYNGTNMAPTSKRRQYGSGRIEHTNGRWKAVVDVAVDGRRSRRSARFDTKQEAESWLKLAAGARARGEVATATITTGAFLAAWLDGPDVTRLAPATRRQYAHVSVDYLLPTVGNVRLSKLTPVRIGAALTALSQPGACMPPPGHGRARINNTLSPGTVAIARRTLRAALSTAVRDGLLVSNPASRAPLPYRNGELRPVHRALTDDELSKVLTVVDDHRVGPLIRFALGNEHRQPYVMND